MRSQRTITCLSIVISFLIKSLSFSKLFTLPFSSEENSDKVWDWFCQWFLCENCEIIRSTAIQWNNETMNDTSENSECRISSIGGVISLSWHLWPRDVIWFSTHVRSSCTSLNWATVGYLSSLNPEFSVNSIIDLQYEEKMTVSLVTVVAWQYSCS